MADDPLNLLVTGHTVDPNGKLSFQEEGGGDSENPVIVLGARCTVVGHPEMGELFVNLALVPEAAALIGADLIAAEITTPEPEPSGEDTTHQEDPAT